MQWRDCARQDRSGNAGDDAKAEIFVIGIWLIHYSACVVLSARIAANGLARHYGDQVEPISIMEITIRCVLGLPLTGIMWLVSEPKISSLGILVVAGILNSAVWAFTLYYAVSCVKRLSRWSLAVMRPGYPNYMPALVPNDDFPWSPRSGDSRWTGDRIAPLQLSAAPLRQA